MLLFKSKRQRELEAEIQVRQSKARIERFIRNCRKVQQRYWDLGKQALRLGDREQYERLAGALLGAREQGSYWERYLLQLETLSVRREEVAATGEFIKGIAAVTTSILRGASPQQVAAMQTKIEQALVKSEALQELLAVAMESSAGAVFASDQLDDRKLDEVARQMTSEAEADESRGYDDRISRGLKDVEEAMRKEL